MLVLGIESSCDETAAAILKDGRIILSNVVASQVNVHRRYGGVVPELASRHHLENVVPAVRSAMEEAGVTGRELRGIAVTQGPGLVGALLVGVNYAKALSFAWGIPLVGVNHLEGHIYSVPLELARCEAEMHLPPTDWHSLFPAVALVVSGGHTSLYWVKRIGHDGLQSACYQLIGRTRDDAAGEAFDKVAKLLHLGYPGGPVIDRLAKRGDPNAVPLPVSKIRDGKMDFSFSGLKTAVLRFVQKNLGREVEEIEVTRRKENFLETLPQPIYDLLASFQNKAIETLLTRTRQAVELYRPRAVMISGGVSCNSRLREVFNATFLKQDVPVYFPSPILSTDNAAMIAAAGHPKLIAGETANLTLNADVFLKLGIASAPPSCARLSDQTDR
jgi:N6-L-threonylcarbamoyladenine synthase